MKRSEGNKRERERSRATTVYWNRERERRVKGTLRPFVVDRYIRAVRNTPAFA